MAACIEFRLYNILVLGFSFMLIFTAFQTCQMVEKTVLDSEAKNHNGTEVGSAYTSLGILYASFSISNWAAPPVVAFIGPKMAMFVGSLLYLLFVVQFLKPMLWALYLCSGLVGFGAAIMWVGQGNFLTINSDQQTVARNSGIFWAMLQCSLLWGNLYEYFVFQGKTEISDAQRTSLFIALSAAGLAGSLCLLFLRNKKVVEHEDGDLQTTAQTVTPESPLMALKNAFRIFKTKDMMLLCFVFAYTGFELTFFAGVYSGCISHTKYFGSDANSLLAISGIFTGVGEILGGAVFGLAGKRTNKYGRDPIIIFGYIVHLVAFYLIFINLPDNSPIEDSYHATYITPNKYLAIFCSFLLGLGDSSFNTQIYSLVGAIYPEDSSAAFSVFKFIQAITAAGGFYYSNALLLQWQLLILIITGTMGVFCFCKVEWSSSAARKVGYQSIGDEEEK